MSSSSKPKPAPTLDSEVKILNSKNAAKRATGGEATETTWPKPEFGPGTTIDWISKEGQVADGFILPAGSMFSLGAAIPAQTVLKHGAYFPPGTMFPDGVLVPIHARMVSVQPLPTAKPAGTVPDPACVIQ